ncbi:MAG: DUF2304 domain-containing protein [Thermoleophilaceae bacterium]
METRIQVVAIIASAGLLLLILELVRQRRLLERYALLWLFSALIMVGLAVWQGGLETIASTIGIAYPPNALFLVAFGFVLVLLLHFSIAVSRLADQSKVLAQRVALLEERQQREEAARGAGPELGRARDDELRCGPAQAASGPPRGK